METKRILIDLSFDYGMNHMGFESSLTRQEIAIDNQKLQKLTIREFCMLTREEVLSADGMTVDKLSAIERLLDEYSLRLGMSAGELDAYLDCYYQERPEEKKFYDLCDRMCESVATSGAKPAFDEKGFRTELDRKLHGNPLDGTRLSDLGWLHYQTLRKAYLSQPWYMRMFASRLYRTKKAVKDAFWIHEGFCAFVTDRCMDSERWNFEHREVKPTIQQ